MERRKTGFMTIPTEEYNTLLKYKQAFMATCLEERQRAWNEASIQQQVQEINSIVAHNNIQQQRIKESQLFPNVRVQQIVTKSVLTK